MAMYIGDEEDAIESSNIFVLLGAMKEENWIIIMEDLTQGKFLHYTLDKNLIIPSIDHVSSIIKSIAHFHGEW
jgi:hypothetical protein